MKAIRLLLPALLAGLLGYLPARAQLMLQREISASNGGSGLIGNLFIQYTVGEPAVTTLAAGNKMLTQGFQQPLDVPPLKPGADPIQNYILYPNPAVHTVKLQFDLLTEGAVMLNLINTAGQQMFRLFQHYGPGRVIIPITVSRLAAGIYTVMLNINGKVFFEKLIIQ